jgi:hypothetical protein
MGTAVGQALPSAVGVALSPLPIVAVVLMLVTGRGRANGLAFVAGWIVALAALGAILLPLAGAGDASDGGRPATWASVLKLVLGALLLLLAGKQWLHRPREGEASPAPKWMSALDTVTPVKAVGLGMLLAGANPKNLLLAIGACAAIAETGISAGQQAGAYAIFAAVGTLGVGAPVAIAVALGERSRPLLGGIRDWLTEHNAAIMATLLLVIGVKLLGDGIAGF